MSGATAQLRLEASGSWSNGIVEGHHSVTGDSSGSDSPRIVLSSTNAPDRRGELRRRSLGTTRAIASSTTSDRPGSSWWIATTSTMSSPTGRSASIASRKVTTRSSTKPGCCQPSVQVVGVSSRNKRCRCIASCSGEIVRSQGPRKNRRGVASRMGLRKTGKAARTSGFLRAIAPVVNVPVASTTEASAQTIAASAAASGRGSGLKRARSSMRRSASPVAPKVGGQGTP